MSIERVCIQYIPIIPISVQSSLVVEHYLVDHQPNIRQPYRWIIQFQLLLKIYLYKTMWCYLYNINTEYLGSILCNCLQKTNNILYPETPNLIRSFRCPSPKVPKIIKIQYLNVLSMCPRIHTALSCDIRKIASPPYLPSILFWIGLHAIGSTSMGIPFFHFWPRVLTSLLNTKYIYSLKTYNRWTRIILYRCNFILILTLHRQQLSVFQSMTQ